MPHLTWKKKTNVTPASSPFSHQSHPVSHLVLLILLSTSFFLKAIQSPLSSHLPPQLEPYLLLPGPLHKPPPFPISFLLICSQHRTLRDHQHPIPPATFSKTECQHRHLPDLGQLLSLSKSQFPHWEHEVVALLHSIPRSKILVLIPPFPSFLSFS